MSDWFTSHDQPLIWNPQPRGHSDITRPYRGIPEAWYDRWVYPNMSDLYMETDAPHQDYDRDGLFRTMGWPR